MTVVIERRFVLRKNADQRTSTPPRCARVATAPSFCIVGLKCNEGVSLIGMMFVRARISSGDRLSMMILIVLIVIAGASTVYWASLNKNQGVYWADRICLEAQFLCDDTRWLLIAVAAVIVVALVWQAMKA